MKILFVKSVPRQGHVGEVKEVSGGFATFLLNSGAAVVATDAVIKQNQKKIEEAQMKAKGEESYAHDIAKKITTTNIKIKGGANNKGNMYKALHKSDVLDAISKEIFATVPEFLFGDISIKTTGNHLLKMQYKGKDLGSVNIEVI